MRWLDALGWFKWPSLLLIAAPVVAYPFWLPATEPAADCGLARVEGQVFRVFRPAEGGDLVLRPVSDATASAADIEVGDAAGFSSGGMVIHGTDSALARLVCMPAP